MSAVLEQPPAPRAAPPTERSGSLLRAEALRFRSRRFIHLMLLVAAAGWALATIIALTQFGVPDEGDMAQARANLEAEVALQNEFRDQCLDDPSLPENVPPEDFCGPPIDASSFRVEDFLQVQPFSFVDNAQAGATGFAAAAAVLTFLVGATWIGAEWSTRSIVALLFWEPRRYRVMGSKLAVLVVAAAVLGVVAQAAWLLMAGILSAAAGDGASVPDGFWGDLVATGGRATLLAVLTALLGFGLTNLVKNTGAALGIGFVYFAVVETALSALRPTWLPWLLTSNAAGLVQDGGQTLFIWDPSAFGATEPEEYVVTNLQGGLVLAAVAAVIVAVGGALFARRDLH